MCQVRRYLAAGYLIALVLLLMGCPQPGKDTDVSGDNATDAPASTQTQWVVQQPQRADIALVFVHGVTGNAIDTWTHENGTRFFDLVANEPLAQGRVDVLAFGYPSYFINDGSFDIREAANRLHSQLVRYQVTNYPVIVFVAHSMGGLVVMTELQRHRELLPKVPVMVLFATPQEGAQIANIGKYVLNNPAMAQLTPADGNVLLQSLSDDWNSIPEEHRPSVVCAYEKLKTGPVVIVPWSSATRFCEGSPAAIEANHSDIVKPDGVSHAAMDVLMGALIEQVLGKELQPKLETPDFLSEGERRVLLMDNPDVVRSARLVNAGGSKLSFTLAEFPNEELFVIPGPGPDELDARSTKELRFLLGRSARKNEYRFFLRAQSSLDSRELEDREVIVRVPNLEPVRQFYQRASNGAAQGLSAFLQSPQGVALRSVAANDASAPEQVLAAFYGALTPSTEHLDPVARWVVAAELLEEVNWPGFALAAIDKAAEIAPNVAEVPAVRGLRDRSEVAVDASAVQTGTGLRQLGAGNPWTASGTAKTAEGIAAALMAIPTLQAQGFALSGDLSFARGDLARALDSYRAAAQVQRTPLLEQRVHELETNKFRAEVQLQPTDADAVRSASEIPAQVLQN